MPEEETGKDPLGAFRGKSFSERLRESSTTAIDRMRNYNYIPPYQPTNVHWEITFRALGWDRETVEKFWTVFCRINKSLTGEVTMMEFLTYFNMDRMPYIEKCFSYFDTTGGDSVDFLEFMVSVWNVCTLKIDTLTNFAFDMYDLDNDGELSFPEIESMVEELYGSGTKRSSNVREVLQDITVFAEERGGGLDLTAFTIYTANHSLLLFPIFQIQRTIQRKVLGMRYWEQVERRRPENFGNVDQHVFDPRHVQILLRTYKTGGAAAVLSHTGDPNSGLREWFEKQNDDNLPFIKQNGRETMLQGKKSKWALVKNGVALNGKPMRNIIQRMKQRMTEEKEKAPEERAAQAFLEAGKVFSKKSRSEKGNHTSSALAEGVDEVKVKMEVAERTMEKFRSKRNADSEKETSSDDSKSKEPSQTPKTSESQKPTANGSGSKPPRSRQETKQSELESKAASGPNKTEGTRNEAGEEKQESMRDKQAKTEGTAGSSSTKPKNTATSGTGAASETPKKRKTPLRKPKSRRRVAAGGSNSNAGDANVRQRNPGAIIYADASKTASSKVWLPPPEIGSASKTPTNDDNEGA